MKAPSSKTDRLREMREAKYEETQAKRAPCVVNVVNNAKIAENLQRIIHQPASNAKRQAKWRETNKDIARERTRNSMRKLRAKTKGK